MASVCVCRFAANVNAMFATCIHVVMRFGVSDHFRFNFAVSVCCCCWFVSPINSLGNGFRFMPHFNDINAKIWMKFISMYIFIFIFEEKKNTQRRRWWWSGKKKHKLCNHVLTCSAAFTGSTVAGFVNCADGCVLFRSHFSQCFCSLSSAIAQCKT